jgi:protein dithiol:quinone oxidoreductase
MNDFFTSKRLFFVALLICISSLLFAAYLQQVVGLEPCPLCLLQRWVLIFITLLLFISLLHRTQFKRYACVLMFFSAVGGAIAGRQVWLQHLPEAEQPSCGPDLSFLLENFPLTEALSYVLEGSGECAIVDWTFLGQSIAVWSLFIFIGLFAAGILAFKKG